ncbi:MAG: MFS transporter [Atribacterota bacterium]|nr:MFS transporter [Atribacterota bacterium]
MIAKIFSENKKNLNNNESFIHLFAYILGSVSFMFTIFNRMNIAVLTPYIVEIFQVTSSSLGFLSGLYFYIYSFSQPFVGVLVDKLKPRKMLALSILIISLGTFTFAFAPNIIYIYLGRFLIGVGSSGIFIPVNWIINKYFPFEKRGFLIFFLQFLGNFGSILAAGPFAGLIRLLGWEKSLSAVGIIALMLGIFVWMVVRDESKNAPEGHLQKEELLSEEKMSWVSIIKSVFGMRIMKYCLLSGIPYAAMMSFQGLWVVSYLIDIYQYDKSTASSLVTLIPTGFVVGLLIFSKLSDKSYGKYIFLGANTFVTFEYLFFAFFTDRIPVNSLAVILFLYGFTHGTTPFILKVYTLILPKKYFGTALGAVNIIPFFTTALYQPFTGLLFDIFGGSSVLSRSASSYRIYFLFSAFTLMIAVWAIYNITMILKKDYAGKI